jgi:hypothetical protein
MLASVERTKMEHLDHARIPNHAVAGHGDRASSLLNTYWVDIRRVQAKKQREEARASESADDACQRISYVEDLKTWERH